MSSMRLKSKLGKIKKRHNRLDSDGKLRIKSHKGLSHAFIEKATREPTVDFYSGDCFLTGRIVIVNDAKQIDKPISTNLIVGGISNLLRLLP